MQYASCFANDVYDDLDDYRSNAQAILQSDFEDIKAKIAILNPDLIKATKDTPQQRQLVIYRSWLAQQAFNWYREYFIRLIEARSTQTGRKLIKEGGPCDEFYWLDRGVLDDISTCYKLQDQVYCDYPENFEEVELVINGCYDGEIFALIDDKDAGITDTFSIYLINNSDINSSYSSDIYLQVNNIQGDYFEWEKYRRTHDDMHLKSWGVFTKEEKEAFEKAFKTNRVKPGHKHEDGKYLPGMTIRSGITSVLADDKK